MNQIASRGQLRMSYLRWALFTVPLILLLGIASGRIAGSGHGNRWFAALAKPDIVPPGWVFATAWPLLYLLIGLAIAMILHARSEEHTSELQSLMRISYAVFCLTKKQ